MNRDLFDMSRIGARRGLPIRRPSIFSPLFDISFERETEPYSAALAQDEKLSAPPTDIEETDEEYILSTDLPGVRKEDIKIECVGNELTISAERKYENPDRRLDLRERYYGAYQRNFTMPSGIDADNIEASYEAGVLTLCIPKAEQIRAKRIEIL